MEIDTENRLLLEKMMRIDQHQTSHHPKQVEPMPAPSSLSMNRLVRLKELVRVNEDNKVCISTISIYFVVNSKETERDPQRIRCQEVGY
jgi:hypothetical protein